MIYLPNSPLDILLYGTMYYIKFTIFLPFLAILYNILYKNLYDIYNIKHIYFIMNMKKLLTYESKVNNATSKSKSLRVGFPKEISEILEAYAGDVVTWGVHLMDDKIIITIQKKDEQ